MTKTIVVVTFLRIFILDRYCTGNLLNYCNQPSYLLKTSFLTLVEGDTTQHVVIVAVYCKPPALLKVTLCWKKNLWHFHPTVHMNMLC